MGQGVLTEKEMVVEGVETVEIGELVSSWDAYARDRYGDLHKLPCYRAMDCTLKELFIMAPGSEVLDAGCGDGSLFKCIIRGIRPAVLMGADWSPEMLKGAEVRALELQRDNHTRIILAQADLSRKFPWPDAHFGAVVCHMVSCFIPNPWEGIMSEIYRVVKPGGYIYLTTFLAGWDFPKIVRKHSLGELFRWPPVIGLYHGLRLKKHPAGITGRAKELGLTYPTQDDLLKFFTKRGAQEVIFREVFWGAGTAARVKA